VISGIACIFSHGVDWLKLVCGYSRIHISLIAYHLLPGGGKLLMHLPVRSRCPGSQLVGCPSRALARFLLSRS